MSFQPLRLCRGVKKRHRARHEDAGRETRQAVLHAERVSHNPLAQRDLRRRGSLPPDRKGPAVGPGRVASPAAPPLCGTPGRRGTSSSSPPCATDEDKKRLFFPRKASARPPPPIRRHLHAGGKVWKAARLGARRPIPSSSTQERTRGDEATFSKRAPCPSIISATSRGPVVGD